MKTVILIGCGNIGFRHLQALLAMNAPQAVAVTILEPDAAQHERIKREAPNARILMQSPREKEVFDLAIIATNSNIRRRVFESLVSQHAVKTVIFEKVVFQTIQDHIAVQEILDERGISAFVNCGRRGFPGYNKLKSEISGPVDLMVTGQSYGLGSNAIHFLDLAEFLNDSAIDSVSELGLHPGWVDSKRKDYREIFGTLRAKLENGAEVSLTCEQDEPIQIGIDLRDSNRTIKVREGAREIEIDGVISEFDSRHVSGMPHIYQEALFGACPLTAYSDSVRQHSLYLRAVRTHMGLSNEDDVPCPIS